MGRVVDVTTRGAKVRIETGRLRLELPDGQVFALALSDVDVLLVSECAIEISGCVLAELSRKGIPVVICGRDYKPTGILLPTSAYHAQTGVLRGQIAAHPSTMPWRVAAGETSLHEALAQAALSLRKCLLSNTVDLELPEALCA